MFETYTDDFMLAVTLWPFVSLLFAVPITAYLYHKRGRIDAAGVIGIYLFVLYLLGLACFTLYPLPEGDSGPGITYGLEPELNPAHFISDLATGGFLAIFQIVANIIFFVPLGFMGRVLFGWKLRRSVILGLIISLCIECSQLTGIWGLYEYSYRLFDVDDLIWNTSGSAVGWVIAAKAFPKLDFTVDKATLTVEHNPGMFRRIVALLLDSTIVLVFGLVIDSGLELLLDAAIPAARSETWIPTVCDTLLFALVQFVIPLLNNGQTPAGTLLHMSCEKFERPPKQRKLFLLVRAIGVYLVFIVPPITAPIAVIVYLACKGMPYDNAFKGESA